MHRLSKRTLAAAFLVCAFLVFPMVRGWNDASRMATVQAIVEHGTFAIEETAFADTGDKVFIDGRFYSDKPPMPSLLGAVVYWPLYMAGVRLNYGVNLAYYLVTLLTVKLLWICGLYCFYRLARATGISEEGSLWLTLALGIGSIHLTWSSTFNNHSVAGSALIIGLYFFNRAAREKSTRRDLFLSGLGFGFAGVSDIPTAIFYAGFTLVALSSSQLRRYTPFFLIPLTVTCLPYLAINWHLHGSIVPVQIIDFYFIYPGSPWLLRTEVLSGTRVNNFGFVVSNAFDLLLGRKGFLLYNPLLAMALAGAVVAMRRGSVFWKEARVIAAGSAIIWLYYSLMTTESGGYSYSIRWFVPLLPLLFLLSFPVMDTVLRRWREMFCAVLIVSVIISTIGLISPWSNEQLSRFPLIANLVDVLNRVLSYTYVPPPPSI